MRRKDRELSGRENIEPILQQCKVCRIAMIADGKPYVIPMNYGYTWGEDGLTLYFHSGLKGGRGGCTTRSASTRSTRCAPTRISALRWIFRTG